MRGKYQFDISSKYIKIFDDIICNNSDYINNDINKDEDW